MTEFIAEIGGNHQGDEQKILRLARDAIASGLKILKFQIYTGESLVSGKYDADRVKHFNSFTLSNTVYHDIISLCKNNNVEFMASIWSEKLLNEFDPHVTRYKIGSGDLTNYPLVKLLAERGKPIILSTGLSNLDEIDETVNLIRSTNEIYSKREYLYVLQCTSVYPCPLNEVNLSVIDDYLKRYSTCVGYSHHTIQYSPIYAAIAMGVDMIEFHYTDTKHDNAFRDHLISIDALEYAKISAFYNESKVFRGNPKKKVTNSEIETGHIQSFRRSLFYKKNFPQGHKLKSEDVVSLRPAVGISSNKLDMFIGLPLAAAVSENEVLLEEHFVL